MKMSVPMKSAMTVNNPRCALSTAELTLTSERAKSSYVVMIGRNRPLINWINTWSNTIWSIVLSRSCQLPQFIASLIFSTWDIKEGCLWASWFATDTSNC